MQSLDSWEVNGYRRTCEECGETYYDSDGSCECSSQESSENSTEDYDLEEITSQVLEVFPKDFLTIVETYLEETAVGDIEDLFEKITSIVQSQKESWKWSLDQYKISKNSRKTL